MSRINAERTSRGLSALQIRGDLQEVARRQARRMAERGQMSHNPNLGGEVCCWRKVGENVGTGTSSSEIHRLMMDSSSHRANILDPAFTEVGVGVERRGDELWVSEVFRQPEGTQDPPPPPPAEPPAPPAEPPPLPPPPPPSPELESPPPAPPDARGAQPEPVEASEPTQDEPPHQDRRPPPACEDATSVALARALSTQTAEPIGEVLAMLCPAEPVRSVGLQR